MADRQRAASSRKNTAQVGVTSRAKGRQSSFTRRLEPQQPVSESGATTTRPGRGNSDRLTEPGNITTTTKPGHGNSDRLTEPGNIATTAKPGRGNSDRLTEPGNITTTAKSGHGNSDRLTEPGKITSAETDKVCTKSNKSNPAATGSRATPQTGRLSRPKQTALSEQTRTKTEGPQRSLQQVGSGQRLTPPIARNNESTSSPDVQSNQSPSHTALSGRRLIMTSSQLKRRNSCKPDILRKDSISRDITANSTLSNSRDITANSTLSNSRDITANSTLRNSRDITANSTLSNSRDITANSTLSNSSDITANSSLSNSRDSYTSASSSRHGGDRPEAGGDSTSPHEANSRRASGHQRISFLHSAQARLSSGDAVPPEQGAQHVTLISQTLSAASSHKSTSSRPSQNDFESDLDEPLPFVRLRNPLRRTLPASLEKMKKRSSVTVQPYRHPQPFETDSYLTNSPQCAISSQPEGQARCLSDDEVGVGMFVRSRSLRVSALIQRFDPSKCNGKSAQDTERGTNNKDALDEIRGENETHHTHALDEIRGENETDHTYALDEIRGENETHPTHALDEIRGENETDHTHALDEIRGENETDHTHALDEIRGENETDHTHALDEIRGKNEADHTHALDEISGENEAANSATNSNSKKKSVTHNLDPEPGNNSGISFRPEVSGQVESSIKSRDGGIKKSSYVDDTDGIIEKYSLNSSNINNHSKTKTSNKINDNNSSKGFSKHQNYVSTSGNKGSTFTVTVESETQNMASNFGSSMSATKNRAFPELRGQRQRQGDVRTSQVSVDGVVATPAASDDDFSHTQSVRARRWKFESAIRKHVDGFHGNIITNRLTPKLVDKDVSETKKTLKSQRAFEQEDSIQILPGNSLSASRDETRVEKRCEVNVWSDSEACVGSLPDSAHVTKAVSGISSNPDGANVEHCEVMNHHRGFPGSLEEIDIKNQPSYTTGSPEPVAAPDKIDVVSGKSPLLPTDDCDRECTHPRELSRFPCGQVPTVLTTKSLSETHQSDETCQLAHPVDAPKQAPKPQNKQNQGEIENKQDIIEAVPGCSDTNGSEGNKLGQSHNSSKSEPEGRGDGDVRILSNLVDTDNFNIHPDYQTFRDHADIGAFRVDCEFKPDMSSKLAAAEKLTPVGQSLGGDAMREGQSGAVGQISRESCFARDSFRPGGQKNEETLSVAAEGQLGCDAASSHPQAEDWEDKASGDRIHTALESLRIELRCLREQDVSLLRQLIAISETIQRLQRSRALRVSKSLSFSSGVLHHNHGSLSHGAMRNCNFTFGSRARNYNITSPTTNINNNNNNNNNNSISYHQCWSCRDVAFHQLNGGSPSVGNSSGFSNGCSSYSTSDGDIDCSTNNSDSIVRHDMFPHTFRDGRAANGSLGSLTLLRRQMSSPSTVEARRQNWLFAGGSFLSSTDSSLSSFDIASELPSPSELEESTGSLHSLFSSAPAIPQTLPRLHSTSAGEMGPRMPDLRLPSAITENESQSDSQRVDTNCDNDNNRVDTKSDRDNNRVDTKSDRHNNRVDTNCERDKNRVDTDCDNDNNRVDTNCDRDNNRVDTNCDNDNNRVDTNSDRDNNRVDTNCDSDNNRVDTNCDNDNNRVDTNCDNDNNRVDTKSDRDNNRVDTNCDRDNNRVDTNCDRDNNRVDTNCDSDNNRVDTNSDRDNNRVDTNSDRDNNRVDTNCDRDNNRVDTNSDRDNNRVDTNCDRDNNRVDTNCDRDNNRVDTNCDRDNKELTPIAIEITIEWSPIAIETTLELTPIATETTIELTPIAIETTIELTPIAIETTKS
ncbi:hypothetical protein RRG08_048223 [Elysia crispata]|uniref:Uncharacterized protein n=1 Tax=Elysia crispata TaxID=231223 RepID=A0AAE0Y0K5_9GAST|nr:hypothetical protein RRG08_048223 [Elysia crispata]